MKTMLRRLQFLAISAAALATFVFTSLSAAAAGAVFNDSGLAIRGYDPVAYFTQQQAVPGKSGITYEWQGVTWQFASAANRQQFIAKPERYAPQYGGYCAYAASSNAIAPTDPQAWSVHNDKLYLNFSTSVRTRWKQDIPGHVERADNNWPGLMKKL